MLRTLGFVFLGIFLFLFPEKTKITELRMKFIPIDKVTQIIQKRPFITLSQDKVVAFADGSKKEFLFDHFIDFSKNGLYITYDTGGNNVRLSFLDKELAFWENKSTFPRLKYPYLFLFNKDMTTVDIVDADLPHFLPAYTLKADGMITSWDVSHNGKYLIIGDLTGAYYVLKSRPLLLQIVKSIYKVFNKQIKIKRFDLVKKKFKTSRVNYIKGISINDTGKIVGLGCLYPKVIFLEDFKNKDEELHILKAPSLGRKKRKIFQFEKNVIIEKENGFYFYNKEEHLLIPHTNLAQIYDVQKMIINDQYFLVILSKTENSTKVEVFMNYQFMYDIYIKNSYLPQFYQNKDKLMIVWENGALQL